ncbi:MAG: hypothetical protein M1827_002383 [Pycnora praestabilis]|nr:MAG: hypothetical protein M1827_002383 [Pycnora praestabilis]
MQPPLRIAILECDTPLDRTRAKYGGYGGVFQALLSAGADALGHPGLSSSNKDLAITNWNVENNDTYPVLHDIDAILITGSRNNAFDNKPWIIKLVNFIASVLAQDRVRVIGVCFGHQIVGRAMGVKVDRSDGGWETSVTPMELSAKGQEIFKQPKLSLHQMHRDIVYEYPKGVEDLGSSPRCRVQGMYWPRKLITVQGHPEFNEEIVIELLEARHDQGIFDDTVYEDAMARVGKHHDGVAVSQAFLRFLLEE